ncbi:MAG: tRNA (adenosine(37)-N6)-threonylcarbamoyltransferase complex ATPase subunit type 1 TsaE [Rickettsiales bacterium]|jgi:tRNA threonylcarbamoyl adenosine modification protein YjeE|nr:tRNA (adenosine(37)-N6)-threonylcarbamoyltransferase complex ATPase subunit type 1 TsaE [Rickettsiales bacterium]
MNIKEIYLDDIEQTKAFAALIAKHLSPGDVVTFSGNLGAGKTSFIKYMINSISQGEVEVTSPSFNLLHIYEQNILEIWHFDLYRLKDIDEIYELGIEDAFIKGVSLIEWPEIIDKILPNNRLEIKLSFANKEKARIVNLVGFLKWSKILENNL